jgi:hypothetical protein
MEIIETSVFTRIIQELLTDDEYAELQLALIRNPVAGAIIKNSGGIRKLRWAGSGRGKRGGIRVIYYWVTADNQIRMLYAYTKNTQSDLDKDQLAALRKIAERWES